MGYKKYDKQERRSLIEAIRSLKDKGIPPKWMPEKLSQMGFTRPGGNGPVQMGFIWSAIGKMRYRAAQPKTIKTISPQTPSTILSILTDPHLNEIQQIRMIRAYAEL